jgi:hypothetical protein
MVKLNCKRCGLTCASKSALIMHLQRKTPCEPKLSNITSLEILRELGVVDASGNLIKTESKQNILNALHSQKIQKTSTVNNTTNNINSTVNNPNKNNNPTVNNSTVNNPNKNNNPINNNPINNIPNKNNNPNSNINNIISSITNSTNGNSSIQNNENKLPFDIKELLNSIDFESLKNDPNVETEDIVYDDKFNVHALISNTSTQKNDVKILFYECVGCKKRYRHKKNIVAHRKYCSVLNDIDYNFFDKYDMQYFYDEDDRYEFIRYLKYQMYQHVKHLSLFLKRNYNLPQSIMVLHALFSYQIPNIINHIHKQNIKDKNGLINLVINEKLDELSNNYHNLFKSIGYP